MKRWLHWFFFPAQNWPPKLTMPRSLKVPEISARLKRLRESPEDRAIAEARRLARNAEEFEKLVRGDR